ncbi:MAG: acyltransferase [bacterium]|nr:acyltransferase [bacterium]
MRDGGAIHLGYRPSFDGLRGLAVSLVIAYHALLPMTKGGFLGVTVFFTLSGFLITYLLCRELQDTGTISLRKFYLRRVLRLIPALVFMATILMSYGFVQLGPPQRARIAEQILGAMFYVANWLIALEIWPKLALLGHTWSLSIEEQFYSLWPLLLLFTLRRWNSPRRLLAVIAGLFVTSGLLRAYYFATSPDYVRPYYSSESNADLLLSGCAVGVIFAYGLLPRGPRAMRWLRIATWASALFVGFAGTQAFIAAPYMYYGGFSAITLATAVLITGVLAEPDGFLAQVFAFPPFVAVGKISYGLYLWHFPANMIVDSLMSTTYMRPTITAVQIATTIALALASYFLVEVHFLKLKGRVSK